MGLPRQDYIDARYLGKDTLKSGKKFKNIFMISVVNSYFQSTGWEKYRLISNRNLENGHFSFGPSTHFPRFIHEQLNVSTTVNITG